MRRFQILVILIVLLSGFVQTEAQQNNLSNTQKKVLCVIAHPDDEVAFAGTIYKITHDLKGFVDILIITNGEAGFKYSFFAEPIYCIALTDEKIGRMYLPVIRKRETLNAGKILGVRNYFFLDQNDAKYTLDINEALNEIWDIPYIKDTLIKRLEAGKYDFVFTLLPHEGTHGHHKAATLLALESINSLKDNRPIVLAADTPNDKPPINFLELKGFPLTKMKDERPFFKFDKLKPLGHQGKLNYQIIVNWVIAEHKTRRFFTAPDE